MKNLLSLVLLTLSLTAMSAPTPYQPKDEEIVNKKVIKLSEGSVVVSDTNGKAAASAYASEGIGALRVARFEYDVTGGDSGAVGAHGLGVYLPANALILRSFFRIDTVFTDSGAGTVALSCEDANNIYSAADITGIGAGVLTTGVQDGFDDLSTVGSGIAAKCEIKATVATAAQDAGKLTGWILYDVHE